MIAEALTYYDHQTIWSIVRSTRAYYLKEIKKDHDERNDNCKKLIPKENIWINLNRTLSLLKLSNVTNDIKNISKSIIVFGAELYIYINSCYKHQHYWEKFKKTIFKKEVSTIVLATFKIISSDLSDDGTMIAKKFVKHLVSTIGFRYIISVENEKNEDFSITRDIANVKGYISFINLTKNSIKMILDQRHLQMVSNHPVHIFGRNGEESPTAFIPFCSFGDDMEAMGTKANGYDDYICSSFEPVVRNDQLCYEVDLEKYKDKEKIEKQLDSGLVLILDYNEDRQIFDEKKKAKKIEKTASVYIETISDNFKIFKFAHIFNWNFLRSSLAVRRRRL